MACSLVCHIAGVEATNIQSAVRSTEAMVIKAHAVIRRYDKSTNHGKYPASQCAGSDQKNRGSAWGTNRTRAFGTGVVVEK
jgi:hypothetical protein